VTEALFLHGQRAMVAAMPVEGELGSRAFRIGHGVNRGGSYCEDTTGTILMSKRTTRVLSQAARTLPENADVRLTMKTLRNMFIVFAREGDFSQHEQEGFALIMGNSLRTWYALLRLPSRWEGHARSVPRAASHCATRCASLTHPGWGVWGVDCVPTAGTGCTTLRSTNASSPQLHLR
jgi:hypothetical protein